MNRSPVVAKWLITITFAFVVLMMATYAMQALSDVGPDGDRMIVLPISFIPEPPEESSGPGSAVTAQDQLVSLSLRHETLGNGFIGPSEGQAFFTVPSSTGIHLAFYGGLLLAFAPGIVLLVLLRKIMTSVGRGEPFNPANVGRIRTIGVVTIAAELVRGLAVLGIQAWLAATAERNFWMTVDAQWNLAIFVLGAVIIALAEVFRYGMQLQSDADLTV